MTASPVVLRWYQEEAVQALFDFFNDPIRAHSLEPANPLVCLPTGTGKSIVIAEFLKRALQQYAGTRGFMATHVKELIKQNAAKMLEIWPLAPLGIYSAGLGQRDTIQPIIFGGIQSVVGKFPLFGRRDILGIDEAHLLNPGADASYMKFIKELREGGEGCNPGSRNANPYLKVIGFTATPYRLGLGSMTNGPIFTHVVYNMCTIEGFNRLIAEGFLCPLIPKRTLTELDVSDVGMTAGEFKQGELEAAVDKTNVTYGALTELVNEGHNRRSWLIFASGIQHAEHIAEMLNSVFGVPTVCIHSKKSTKENEASLAAWQSGKARAAVNMNALTTGVDHPPCDLIGMLRPTMSTGLWVQMLGRGTRPYPDKDNCLVLDFAGNTRRLGPINDPVIPKMKGQGPPGDAPVRICPKCGVYNHATAKVCLACGHEFGFQENISRTAGTEELLRSTLPQIEYFPVQRVVLTPHTSLSSGRPSIKVAYFCKQGAIPRTFYEYISVESPVAFQRHKSRDWFRQRYHYQTAQYTWDNDVPYTNAEVLALASELRVPRQIRVWINKKTPEVMGYEF
jgi:DNA repair protein RadD